MHDEAIEEIRNRRKKMLLEDFGGSIERFGEEARKWQCEHPDRVVNLHDLNKATRQRARQG
jgi:hypothetical protein